MVFNENERQQSDPRSSILTSSTISIERPHTPEHLHQSPSRSHSPTSTSMPTQDHHHQKGYYNSSADTTAGFGSGSSVHRADTHDHETFDGDNEKWPQNHPYSPKKSKSRTGDHPYKTEWRERQGSGSSSSYGDHDMIHGAGAYAGLRKKKSFFQRLTTCFEFDESSDPVRRYRSKHEEMYGRNPVYTKGETEPSQYNAPNSFAGGMTGASGTGGAGAGGGCGGGGGGGGAC